MSKRAEEAAKEIYKDGIELFGRRDKNNNLVIQPETMVGILRNAAQRGYEQAEEDLALTVADIERIHVFLYAVKNNKQGAFTFQKLKDEQYQEVLEKFNNAKDYDTEQDTD